MGHGTGGVELGKVEMEVHGRPTKMGVGQGISSLSQCQHTIRLQAQAWEKWGGEGGRPESTWGLGAHGTNKGMGQGHKWGNVRSGTSHA